MFKRKYFIRIFFILKSLSISKSSDMVKSLKNMSKQMTFDQIEQASSGLFPTIVNSLIVIDFKKSLVRNFFNVKLKIIYRV